MIIHKLQNHLAFLESRIIIDYETYCDEMKILNDALHQMKEIINGDYQKFNEVSVEDVLINKEQLCVIFDIARYEYVIESFNKKDELINGFCEKNKFNPFIPVKKIIIDIMMRRGYSDFVEMIKFLFYVNPYEKLSFENKDLFNTFEMSFMPLNCKFSSQITNYFFMVHESTLKIASLIDCVIKINVKIPRTESTLIVNGMIKQDPLNTLIRGSKLSCPYIHNLRLKLHSTLKTIEVPKNFWSTYLENMNCSNYFIYSIKKLVTLIEEDYQLFLKIIDYKMKNLLELFMTSEIKMMIKILFLLSLGDKTQMIGFLYQSLEERKGYASLVAPIIFNNSSYSLQILLMKSKNDLKSEIQFLKNITLNDISIEKRLAIASDMPDTAKAYILEKLKEIKTETNISKNEMAIDGLLNFPWKPKNAISIYHQLAKDSEQARNYLLKLQNTLNQTIYGHDHAKKSMMELNARWIKNPDSGGKIIGYCGPPGVGKTLLATALAQSIDAKVIKINLGGMDDASELLGHAYSYASATYGLIVRKMISAGSWKCVICLDELGKTGKKETQTSVQDALIHVLDSENNQKFQDRFYAGSVDFDLSGVLFVVTFNIGEKFDPALYDRMEVINVYPYSTDDKMKITKQFLIPKVEKIMKLNLSISEEIIKYIIDYYTFEGGVRTVNRLITSLYEKINFILMVNYQIDNIVISKEIITKLLGEPKYQIEKINSKDEIGVTYGMYTADSNGGGVMPIQINYNYLPTKNELFVLTGNQQGILKESIHCAYNVVGNYVGPEIMNNILEKYKHGFHIHVMDASSPKDGPSAGASFCVAFYSIFTNKKINRYVCVTGEIGLDGSLHKVGGIDQKLNGAHRAGIKIVFIPEDNKIDLMECLKRSKYLEKSLEIRMVSNIKDIFSDKDVFI